MCTAIARRADVTHVMIAPVHAGTTTGFVTAGFRSAVRWRTAGSNLRAKSVSSIKAYPAADFSESSVTADTAVVPGVQYQILPVTVAVRARGCLEITSVGGFDIDGAAPIP